MSERDASTRAMAVWNIVCSPSSRRAAFGKAYASDAIDRGRAPWIGAPKNGLDSTDVLDTAAPGADLVGGDRCVSQGWKAALY